jgi:hypothetical protein
MSIPTSDTVTTGWLTEQLHRAGHTDTEVTGFNATQIGTGQIGKCVRYELQHSNPNTEAPATLVGKFPSDDPLSQATGVALRNYSCEVNFYQSLVGQVTIPVPKCYYAEIVEPGPEFALLLEDLSPAVQGNQLEGCSAAVAEAAVNALIGLQVPSWCHSDLKSQDWLMPPKDSPPDATRAIYQQTLPAFLDRFRAKLTAEQAGIIEQVADSPNCPLFAPLTEPFCLEHVDYRLDNLMIDERGPTPTVTALDWQSLKLGRPLNDVAYFLGAGLRPEVRREVEEDIVRGYHQRLLDAGIPSFDWSTCWQAYRRATFSGFAVTVVASVLVQQTERGDHMFHTMAQRHSQHALDLGAAEFLS